jgi:Tol biopolymer transport system component
MSDVSGKMRTALVLGWLSLLWVATANAQLHIEIRRGVERPVPIAIVPFAWEVPAGMPAAFDVSGLAMPSVFSCSMCCAGSS